ncbi:hypothetical protein HDV00_002856 [Rhizophlyctis rosea]|nr:hypothetical protein HDV00_002856 [Rhizophlyctis rosea]
MVGRDVIGKIIESNTNDIRQAQAHLYMAMREGDLENTANGIPVAPICGFITNGPSFIPCTYDYALEPSANHQHALHFVVADNYPKLQFDRRLLQLAVCRESVEKLVQVVFLIQEVAAIGSPPSSASHDLSADDIANVLSALDQPLEDVSDDSVNGMLEWVHTNVEKADMARIAYRKAEETAMWIRGARSQEQVLSGFVRLSSYKTYRRSDSSATTARRNGRVMTRGDEGLTRGTDRMEVDEDSDEESEHLDEDDTRFMCRIGVSETINQLDGKVVRDIIGVSIDDSILSGHPVCGLHPDGQKLKRPHLDAVLLKSIVHLTRSPFIARHVRNSNKTKFAVEDWRTGEQMGIGKACTVSHTRIVVPVSGRKVYQLPRDAIDSGTQNEHFFAFAANTFIHLIQTVTGNEIASTKYNPDLDLDRLRMGRFNLFAMSFKYCDVYGLKQLQYLCRISMDDFPLSIMKLTSNDHFSSSYGRTVRVFDPFDRVMYRYGPEDGWEDGWEDEIDADDIDADDIDADNIDAIELGEKVDGYGLVTMEYPVDEHGRRTGARGQVEVWRRQLRCCEDSDRKLGFRCKACVAKGLKGKGVEMDGDDTAQMLETESSASSSSDSSTRTLRLLKWHRPAPILRKKEFHVQKVKSIVDPSTPTATVSRCSAEFDLILNNHQFLSSDDRRKLRDQLLEVVSRQYADSAMTPLGRREEYVGGHGEGGRRMLAVRERSYSRARKMVKRGEGRLAKAASGVRARFVGRIVKPEKSTEDSMHLY